MPMGGARLGPDARPFPSRGGDAVGKSRCRNNSIWRQPRSCGVLTPIERLRQPRATKQAIEQSREAGVSTAKISSQRRSKESELRTIGTASGSSAPKASKNAPGGSLRTACKNPVGRLEIWRMRHRIKVGFACEARQQTTKTLLWIARNLSPGLMDLRLQFPSADQTIIII